MKQQKLEKIREKKVKQAELLKEKINAIKDANENVKFVKDRLKEMLTKKQKTLLQT